MIPHWGFFSCVNSRYSANGLPPGGAEYVAGVIFATLWKRQKKRKKKKKSLYIARTETKVKANRCLCINQNLASTFKNMNPSIVYHNTTYKIYNNLDLGWSDTNMSIS